MKRFHGFLLPLLYGSSDRITTLAYVLMDNPFHCVFFAGISTVFIFVSVECLVVETRILTVNLIQLEALLKIQSSSSMILLYRYTLTMYCIIYIFGDI